MKRICLTHYCEGWAQSRQEVLIWSNENPNGTHSTAAHIWNEKTRWDNRNVLRTNTQGLYHTPYMYVLYLCNSRALCDIALWVTCHNKTGLWCQLNSIQTSPAIHVMTPFSCVSFPPNTQPSAPTIETFQYSSRFDLRFPLIMHFLQGQGS